MGTSVINGPGAGMPNHPAMTLQSCSICDAPVSRWRTKDTPAGRFAMDRCTACGFAFVNPRPGLDFLMRFYATSGHRRDAPDAGASLESVLQGEAAFPNSTLDARRMLRSIHSLLPPLAARPAEFLDVGCGYGFYAREAAAAGFNVSAIELASAERSIARSIAGIDALDVPFEQFVAKPGQFSVVLMSQILEHALDVRAWLTKANHLLCDDGLIVIALPNFGSLIRRVLQEKDPFVTPPAHLNYFDPHNLERLLTHCGFTVRRVQHVTRIPPGALRNRLGRFGAPVATAAHGLLHIAARAMDLARVGMMITLYASKNTEHERHVS
ncbi:MAG: class I SAM-dependent methyltransferase [Burkholderiales bacterium]